MSSPFNNAATDGTDVGVDYATLLAGIADLPDPAPAPPPITGGTTGSFVEGTLDWAPTMPDRALRLAPRRGSSVHVLSPVPIPNVAPPTELTWQGFYPNSVTRPRVYLRQRFRAEPIRDYPHFIGPPFADPRWLAVYPNTLPRPRALAPRLGSFVAPNVAIIRTPVTGHWRPFYPDRLVQPRRFRPENPPWLLTDHTAVLNDVSCIEWTTETTTRPSLVEDSVVHPTAPDEILVRSTLSEEDLC